MQLRHTSDAEEAMIKAKRVRLHFQLALERNAANETRPILSLDTFLFHNNKRNKRAMPRESVKYSEMPLRQANVRKMSDVSELDPDEQEEPRETMSPYTIRVSASFILGCFLFSVILAYASGRIASLVLIEGPQREFLEEYRRQTILRDRRIGVNPYYKPPPPRAQYPSNNLASKRIVATSSWLMTSGDYNWLEGDDQRISLSSESGSLSEDDIDETDDEEDEDDDEEEEEGPQPTAEQLRVDIKNVDKDFLNSEQRLVRAMLGVIKEAKLMLLSYHCHGFFPSGVSCVGLLSQNYVAFHTWPAQGVIMFDLCTAESNSVLSLLPTIQRLFGVPRTLSFPGQVVEQPAIRWAHKLRGFHQDATEVSNMLLADLGQLLGDFGAELKNEVSQMSSCLR